MTDAVGNADVTEGPARMAAQRVAAQTAMELRLLLRNTESLLVTMVIPAGLLTFFSLVPVLPTGDEDAVAFLAPGVLALAVMSAALVSLAIATGFERFYLVLKRLGATPLRRSELVIAKIFAVLGVEALQIVVLAGLALVLGWRPALHPGRVVLAVFAVLLATAAFAGLGLAMAGRLRAVATLALANALYLVMLLVSGIAFPLSLLPQSVATVARLLPATALAHVLRAVLNRDDLRPSALLVLAVWAVVAPLLAARVFRWD